MDLPSSFNSLSLKSAPGTITNFAAIIKGNHTEIVLNNFVNNLTILITQFGKIGNLFQVRVDQPINGVSATDPVYTITPILGGDNIDAEVGVRYLTEKLKVKKPVVISLCLKDYSRDTINSIIEAIAERE